MLQARSQAALSRPAVSEFLKIAVAIMTAILLLGIVALVYGVGQQVSKLGTAGKPVAASVPPAHTPYARVLDLGQGKLEIGRGERRSRHSSLEEVREAILCSRSIREMEMSWGAFKSRTISCARRNALQLICN